MSFAEDLERLYRQDCIALPVQCETCEHGKRADCKLYNSYMNLRRLVEIHEILSKYFVFQIDNGYYSGLGNMLSIVNKEDFYSKDTRVRSASSEISEKDYETLMEDL